MKQTMVICAYPASGKTYICNKYNKLKGRNSHIVKLLLGIDFWSDIVFLDMGTIKLNKFYKNSTSNVIDDYIAFVKKNMGKADIIFINSNKSIRKALRDNNIKYFMVFPELNMKEEIIQRMIKRGDNIHSIKFQRQYFESLIKDIDNECREYNISHYKLNKTVPYLNLEHIIKLAKYDQLVDEFLKEL